MEDIEIEELKKLQELVEVSYQQMVKINEKLTVFVFSSAWNGLKCQIGGAKAIMDLMMEEIGEFERGK